MTRPTFADLVLRWADDDGAAVRFEDDVITYRQFAGECLTRAAYLGDRLDPGADPNVGVLLENVPDFLYWIGAAAIAGATVVGVNPTRRGAELARDIAHTKCQFVVTTTADAALLADDVDTLLVDEAGYGDELARYRTAGVPSALPGPAHPLLLLFTSGSTSAPKAVVCSTARLAGAGLRCVAMWGLTRDTVSYCPMPLFHGNALMACWSPTLAAGGTVVLRRKFSASGFLDDVRRHGCTFFTYVGRSIAYVLAQPPTEHDRDNRLVLGFGTEASLRDRELFRDRFGCELLENYGSSESVIVITRTPDTPPAALGRPEVSAHSDVIVASPDSGEECPPARFDRHGAIENPESIGELVNRAGLGTFEGYYDNPEATAARLRNGWYWSGDLAYRDEAGFFYFAGRSADWLRVDSENFAAAPVETILHRFAGAVMVAVYPVPDTRTGDQVMAALELRPGEDFDPVAFGRFLADQPDLGTKWAPRYVRITADIPLTANNKVNKQPLRSQAWRCDDPVWWRPGRELTYRPLTDADRETLAAEAAAAGSLRPV